MLSSNDSTPAPSLLIVEDEFMIANGLRRILEKAGYQVTGLAESVAEAQLLVAQQQPTIVLVDIFLKGEQTGIELAEWLGEQDIPFVFLSANLTDDLLEAAKVTKPFGFLNKPFREKDVLAMLEIARYRHMHSAEAQLQQHQGVQMAVNDAITTLHDRDQLCLTIAAHLNKLVPFSLLNLRIGQPGEDAFYWLMLRKTAANTFERLPHLPQLLNDQPEVTAPDVIAQPGEEVEVGLFTGAAFVELCARSASARACRDQLGIRSLALFPIVLKHRSTTSIHLGCTEPDGFTPKDYEMVKLMIPPIALALDNLLASEEIDARRKLKVVELAIVRAFQSGKSMGETANQIAQAINELMPLDLLLVQRVGPSSGLPGADSLVYKEQGEFGPLADEKRTLPASITPAMCLQTLAALEPWLVQPMLGVGEILAELQNRDAVTQYFSKQLPINSVMSVPILIKNEPQAALIVASKAAYAFTQKDLRTLQDLSVQLALVLENIAAFEHIKRLSEQLEREKSYLVEEIKTSHNFEEIIGTSPGLLSVLDSLGQVAPTDYTVLVLGETGTGKELIARAVHNLSRRKDRTMVKVNCAALPAQLIESELFGHEKGSYTGATDKRIGKFELAHGSTIFLDEIGELPLELQAKLLRVLQEGEIERLGGKGIIRVDVRVVAATNRSLQQEVATGRFRADLYYRLNVFPVVVPPLRERREDILPLALHFLQKISKKLGKPLTGLSQAALQQLRLYAWPGNVRELEHVLERAAILSRTAKVELAEPLLPTPELLAASEEQPPQPVKSLQDGVRDTILAALAQANYRIRGQGGAAELLALKPTTLEARMRKLQIAPVGR